MTIHEEHPFRDPEPDPLRRFRGRMPAPVSVWATGVGRERAGWTVSSLLVADGDPGQVLGLIDEDSELAAAIEVGTAMTVSLLGEPHRYLAEVFAGLAPAPGGAFTQGEWADGSHGPVLADAVGRLDVRVSEVPRNVGWPLLVRAEIEAVELGEEEALLHLRGQYRTTS